MYSFYGFVAVLFAVLNSKPAEMAAEVAAKVVFLAWLGLQRQNRPRWWPLVLLAWLPHEAGLEVGILAEELRFLLQGVLSMFPL